MRKFVDLALIALLLLTGLAWAANYQSNEESLAIAALQQDGLTDITVSRQYWQECEQSESTLAWTALRGDTPVTGIVCVKRTLVTQTAYIRYR